MNKILVFAFVIGLLLRLVLSVTTYHSDIGAFALSGHYILNQGKVLTFYDMTRIENETVFNYQPLAYIYPAFIYIPFSNLVEDTYKLVQNDKVDDLKAKGVYWPLVVYKLPMLIADCLIFFLIPLFFLKIRQKILAQLLWWFNPISIYVGSMMGQVDIVIAALLTISLLCYLNKKLALTAIFIGLSALFKPIGLVLLPLLFLDSKSLKASIIGVGVYILGILPFLSSQSYRYYAMAAEQMTKSTYAGIAIASGTLIPWFFIFMAIIALLLWYKKISFLRAGIAIVLSSLVFSHFHPQWMIWSATLLLVYVIKYRRLMLWPLFVGCWFFVLLSFDSSLHSGMFLFEKWNLVLPKILENVVLLSRAGLIAILLILMGWSKQVEK